MQRPRGLPIAAALATAIGLLVLVAVALVFATGYEVARRNTAELTRDKADLVIAAVIERTRNHLNPAKQQLQYLAGLIAAGRLDLDDRNALVAALAASLAAVPQVSVAAFVYPDLLVLRAFRNRPERPFKMDDWGGDPDLVRAMREDAARADVYWGDLFVAEESSETFINARMPIHVDGRFRGTLIAGVSIKALSAFLSELRGDFTHNSFILSGMGSVLAHPLLLSGYPGLSDKHPLPRLTEFGDPVLSEIWSPARRPEIEAGLAGRAQVRAVDFAGLTYVFLFRRLDGYGEEPWFVGTHLELAEAAGQMGRLDVIIQIGLVILIGALILALALGRTLAEPVRRLAMAAARVRELDLDDAPNLPQGPYRELNEAAGAFSAMVAGLRWFETYVPRSLVRRLMRQGGEHAVASEERQITILFTAIVDFTARAENLPAAEVARFLNQHFALVGRCVEEQGGTIDKYIGDAVMAFWGAPERQPDHAERACRAALAIVRAIRDDNADRAAAGLVPVRLMIGIHSGPAIVGNIGAPTRINYTIIGDSVNTAERLEALAREVAVDSIDVCVLVSGDSAAKLGSAFALTPLAPHHLRGRHEPIEAHPLEPEPQSTTACKGAAISTRTEA
jgi:class 3 adenylate cyclase